MPISLDGSTGRRISTDLRIKGWDLDRSEELRARTHVLASAFLYGAAVGGEHYFSIELDADRGEVDDEGYVFAEYELGSAEGAFNNYIVAGMALCGWVLCTEPRPAEPPRQKLIDGDWKPGLAANHRLKD